MYLLFILSALAAAPSDQATVTAGDVLNCDFEVRTDRDYDGWPDGWKRKYSRELPEFLKVGIIQEPTAAASSGDTAKNTQPNHCLEIELNGGAASRSQFF